MFDQLQEQKKSSVWLYAALFAGILILAVVLVAISQSSPVESEAGAAAAGGMGLLVGFLVAGLFVYFVPTLVATGRAHHNTAAIVMLNLFLGWTFLGWVAALVWAMTETRRERG